MYENEPRRPRGFILRFEDGAEIRCTPETTHAFVHSEDSFADHIWVYDSTNPEDAPTGTYFFRPQIENFDDILLFMIESDFNVIPSNKVTLHDREAYEAFIYQQQELKREKVAKEIKQIMPPPAELWVSERQQRIIDNHIAFELYLIQHNKLNEGEQL